MRSRLLWSLVRGIYTKLGILWGTGPRGTQDAHEEIGRQGGYARMGVGGTGRTLEGAGAGTWGASANDGQQASGGWGAGAPLRKRF